MNAVTTDNNLVSIIVPVYNVEKWLEQCVNSVLSQTYKKFELILVDDGSTDNSGSICDSLARSDNRIKVFHKQNGGLSSARNYGLSHAGGYVVFVDSDDMISPTLLESCLENISRTGSDIVEYQYSSIDENGNPHPYSGSLNDFQQGMYMSADDALRLLFKGNIEPYAWAFMAKRSLYENPVVIRFPEGKIFEDAATTYKLFARANQISLFTEKLYLYRQRSNSIMHSAKKIIFSEMQSLVAMDRLEYFTGSLSLAKNVLSEKSYDVLVLKTLEMQVASYYGILRLRDNQNNAALLDEVKKRILLVMKMVMNGHPTVPLGTAIRAYAVKFNLARFLVLVGF